MSLFRHREIYRSDVSRLVRERRTRRPRPHRLDEFPAGYSSAGCSPAEPASASPAVDHSALQSSCRSSVFHRTANSVLTVCLSPGARPTMCPRQHCRNSDDPLDTDLETRKRASPSDFFSELLVIGIGCWWCTNTPEASLARAGVASTKRRGIAQPGAERRAEAQRRTATEREARREVWGRRLCARGAEPLSHGEWRCGEGTSPLGWVTEDRRG
jgi:hypothetical protein